MHVRFSRRSEDDLEEIADYIALDSPISAVRFIRKLRKHCQSIARFPKANQPRFDLYEQMHSIAFGRYVIFYHVGKQRQSSPGFCTAHAISMLTISET